MNDSNSQADAAVDTAAELEAILEAALFAAGKPLSLNELVHLFDEAARPAASELRAALKSLAAVYQTRAIELLETASGFRMQVRARYAGDVSKLWPERPQRYSRALLETLALIAYRQPITRAEIEGVRGVAVNPNIIKTLIDRAWIRVVGHRDVPGHPELLGTTREFLDHFGMKSVDELPPLAEIRAMTDINPQLDLPGTAESPGVGMDMQSPPLGDDPVESSLTPSAEALSLDDELADEGMGDDVVGDDEPEHQAHAETAPGLVAAGPEHDR
jgi:segregation and condensation protein B